jgi:hypothetical protein
MSVAVVGVASAQAPFTVVSPRNYNADTNSPVVREKIVLKFPKNSVPSSGYVGIFMGKTRGEQILDEKFIEATTLQQEGNYLVYRLDTKAKGIADDLYTIRAVLYVDYADRPREINQTQVNVRVGNISSIKIPNKGFNLRYKFDSGTQWKYRVEMRNSQSVISSVQQTMGVRAAELPAEAEVLRYLYSIESNYGNGDGLLRLQIIPREGRRHEYYSVNGQVEKWYNYQMAGLYGRFTSTGNEIFTSIPFAHNTADFGPIRTGATRELFGNFPLPNLPTRPVRPGDSWPTRSLQSNLKGSVTPEDSLKATLYDRVPMRGEFVGVEWEMGHPCAKIRNSLEQGSKTKEGQMALFGKNDGVNTLSSSETIWFALDLGRPVKIVRDQTIDAKTVVNGMNSSGRPGPDGGGENGEGGRPGRPGPKGPGSTSSNLFRQAGTSRLGGTQMPGSGFQPGGGNNGGRGSNQGGGSQTMFIRQRNQLTFILEQ